VRLAAPRAVVVARLCFVVAGREREGEEEHEGSVFGHVARVRMVRRDEPGNNIRRVSATAPRPHVQRLEYRARHRRDLFGHRAALRRRIELRTVKQPRRGDVVVAVSHRPEPPTPFAG
jgi:hypothetical protein